MGPFAGYRPNAAAMIGVISKHRAAVGNIANAETVPADLLSAARKAWDEALDLGEVNGYRNAQATVLAPTGTISFMMDCDTTGVEPDFSLVKSKKLVGGGEITIVNKTVPLGLEKLGYAPNEVDEIVAFIDERNTDRRRAVREERALPGVRLRGRRAGDPLPRPREDDGRDPAVHLGRDLEDGQPAGDGDDRGGRRRSTSRRGGSASRRSRSTATTARSRSRSRARARRASRSLDTAGAAAAPRRRRLPEDRTEIGRKFRVGEYEGYIHVGVFDDGTPGDIFVDIAKDGTTLAGLMNSLMIAVSMGLQYGVPLEVYVSKLRTCASSRPARRTTPTSAPPSRSSTTSSGGSGRSSSTSTSRRRRGSSPPRCGPSSPTSTRTAGSKPAVRGTGTRPDGALQLLRGCDRVQPLRWPDGAGRHLLHLPRLRYVDRLRLSRHPQDVFHGGPANAGPPSYSVGA